MKNAAMALFIMSGLFLGAQEGERKGNRADWKSMTPEQVATLQTKKMTLALDLTEAQQTKMKALLATKAEERKAHMASRQERKTAGAEAPSTAERYAMANERLDRQIAFKEEISQILNDAQYIEWEAMQKQKKHRARGKKHQKGKRGAKR